MQKNGKSGEKTSSNPSSGNDTPNRPLKILVADDTPLNLHLVQKLLTRKGHSVIPVEDGQKVLDAIQKEPFDAILMDVQMPVMDGIEATRTIRAWEEQGLQTNLSAPGKKIPIIALTANDQGTAHKTCLGAGMNGVIAKPIDVKSLLTRLTSIISHSREDIGNAR